MTIRVVMADDHPLILDGLDALFRSQPDVAVVGRCLDGETALATVRGCQPDVLLLDLRMPGLDGLEVMRSLHAERATVHVVLLTAAYDEPELMEAIELGVRGVVVKEAAPETLLRCVRCVYQGELWFPRATLHRALDRALERDKSLRKASEQLTPREVDIVRLVSQGLRNKEIGERLAISEGTVKIHLHRVYEKLGVDGRVALSLYARDKGLL